MELGSPNDWNSVYRELVDVKREYESMGTPERETYVNGKAKDLCGEDMPQLISDTEFWKRMSETRAYKAEFMLALTDKTHGNERKRLYETKTLQEDAERRATMRETFAGYHPKIAKLRFQAAHYLRFRMPILLIGERGVGKGALATMASTVYPYAPPPAKLYRVSMAGIPDELAESLLFGHEKGAFTDAKDESPGVFRMAMERDNSLILLDDVPEASPKVQPKLLTLLEDGEMWPLGRKKPVKIGKRGEWKFHLLSAAQPGSLNKLRPDLRDRLGTFPLLMPTLRELGADCLMLAEAMTKKVIVTIEMAANRRPRERASDEAPNLGKKSREVLLHYDWPGNVRQLANVATQAVARSWGKREIDPTELKEIMKQEEQLRGPDLEERHAALDLASDWPSLKDLERRYMGLVFDRHGGNQSATAKALGCGRSKVRRWMARDAGGAIE